jgi:hypothetical protein
VRSRFGHHHDGSPPAGGDGGVGTVEPISWRP